MINDISAADVLFSSANPFYYNICASSKTENEHYRYNDDFLLITLPVSLYFLDSTGCMYFIFKSRRLALTDMVAVDVTV